MKKVLFFLLLLCSVLLIACGPDVKDDDLIKLEDLMGYLDTTVSTYETAEHGSYKVVTTGSKATELEMIYNYGFGGLDLQSLKLVWNNNGEITSCYVFENYAYMLYGDTKTKVQVTSDEATKTIEQYSFANYANSILKMLGASFQENATVTEDKDGLATVTVDLSTYALSENDDDQSYELSELIDSIRTTKKEFKVNFTYADSKISQIEIKLVSLDDTISTIKLQFLGVSNSEIEITYPDFSEYSAN